MTADQTDTGGLATAEFCPPKALSRSMHPELTKPPFADF